MGGGHGSGGSCSANASGSFDNLPAPPRKGGKYKTLPLDSSRGVSTRKTGIPTTGKNTCGGDYTWGEIGLPGGCLGKGSECAPTYPYADYCPKIPGGGAIGNVTQTDWAGHQVMCSYDSVTAPMAQLSKYFDTNTINQIMNDRCGAMDYHTLLTDGDCKQFYAADMNNQLLKRIGAINGWTGDGQLAAYVNNVMKGGSGITATDQGTATNMIQTACDATPTDPMCSCYNVTKFGDACLNDPAKKTLPGCAGLVKEFASLPAGATVGLMNKFCSSDDCANALNADSALLPGPNPKACNINIAQCVNDFSNAKLTNSPVSADCQNTLNVTGTNPPPPPPPPPSSGAPAGGATTPAVASGGAPAAAGGGDATASSSAATGPNKGLIIGLGVCGFCLFMLCIAFVLYIITRKKNG